MKKMITVRRTSRNLKRNQICLYLRNNMIHPFLNLRTIVKARIAHLKNRVMITLINRIFRLKIIKLKSMEFNIIKKYSSLVRNKKTQTTNNFNFLQILARIFKGKESVNKRIIQIMKKLMKGNYKKDMEKVLKCYKC